MRTNKNFFILAGERSGDIHGGMLMESIHKIDSTIQFSGIGGSDMESQGLQSLVPINKMAVIGFVEVIKHLSFFKQVESDVLSAIDNNNPDRIILIDFPGFNLRIAQKIKLKYNIPITYYISPQLWAWKEKRINIVKKYIDQMLVILPFEKEWYAKRGIDVDWIGHPYLDYPKSDLSKDELKAEYGVDKNNLLITLFPGSRQQELDKHIDLFISVSKNLLRNNSNVNIAIGLAPGVELKEKYKEISIIENKDSHRLLGASDILLTASGTATLEAAILGIPMAVVYQLNILTWVLSKLLVKIQYIALPNIILNKPIVPEFIQSNAKSEGIIKYIQTIIDDSEIRESTGVELSNMQNLLGEPGASDRAAEKILNHEK